MDAKPSVFFSHSSKDQPSLVRLREHFLRKTGGSIEVFLSSDGQSIPFGRNWVHGIEQALERSLVMMVFVSPRSLTSSWLYFESGFAYSKGVRVVPVGFDGVDLASVPPPLSLLQGFNITSEAGLNNLIAICNQSFGHSHSESFTASDYREIFVDLAAVSSSLGHYASVVDSLMFSVYIDGGRHSGRYRSSDQSRRPEPIHIGQIHKLLVDSNVEVLYNREVETFFLYGVTINCADEWDPREVEINIDPWRVDACLSVILDVIRLVAGSITKCTARVYFVPSVTVLSDTHKITGRLYGSGVRLAATEDAPELLSFDDIAFSVERDSPDDDGIVQGPVVLKLEFMSDSVSIGRLGDLVTLLFSRKVLFEGRVPT